MDRLVQFPALLFSTALTSEGLFRPTLVTRLQVERVLLDILDDIFLLNFTLETAEGAFDRFAVLHFHLSHCYEHPLSAEFPAGSEASGSLPGNGLGSKQAL